MTAPSASLRITHVQGIFSPEHGGPTFSLANYCRGQAALGHHVSLRVLEGHLHSSAALRMAPPLDMAVDPVDRPVRLGRSATLRRRLRADPTPDIYHLHGAWLRAMHYGATEARRRRRPYVVELMGMYEPWPLRQKWLVKKISRLWYQDDLLRRASCLHVNSRNEAEALRRLGFRTPIVVIPVGVDTARVGAASHSIGEACPYPALVRRQFVLFLARIHSKKGIELLIRSWAKLDPNVADCRLVIAGAGSPDYVRQCQELIAQLNLGDRCLWVGPVDEAQKGWLYRQAECYVLPSYSENFGNTVAEALAHGTPVITTPHTVWTHLPEGGCGWIADTTEAVLGEVLTAALQTDAAERLRMGERGRQLVEHRYSLTAVVNQLDRVYRWLLGGPRPDDLLYDLAF